MLITREQLIAATDLSVAQVEAAIRVGGYGTDRDEIKSVEFLGMNQSGRYVYDMVFDDPIVGTVQGRVYLQYLRLPMTTAFVLSAEF